MDPHVPLDILEYRDRAFRQAGIRAIRELPLRVVAHGRDMVTLQCTGMHPRFLVAGYLFGCGLIEGPGDIRAMEVTEDAAGIEVRVELARAPAGPLGVSLNSAMGRDILTPGPAPGPARGTARGPAFGPGRGPGLPPVPAPQKPFLRPENILRLAGELHERSSLYRLTRGCHNASLCSAENMLVFRSDIGRHNAIDTLVGQCLLENIPMGDKMIVSTGRIAAEIAHKAVRAGVGVYASIAVATSQAVEIARTYGLTLIGNVTEDKFWVYHDPGRLVTGS